MVVWRYKLLDVQQRELILTKRCGELETELKVAGTRNRDLEEKVTDLQKSLRMEKVSLWCVTCVCIESYGYFVRAGRG